MINISIFTAALIFEIFCLLVAATLYYLNRYRRTQRKLRELNATLQNSKQPTVDNEPDILDQKQEIIGVLLEKLDCFDENNSELASFRDKFLSLRKDYLNLRQDEPSTDEEGTANSEMDRQNDHIEVQLMALEQELQHILGKATTIIGQMNREKMTAK